MNEIERGKEKEIENERVKGSGPQVLVRKKWDESMKVTVLDSLGPGTPGCPYS